MSKKKKSNLGGYIYGVPVAVLQRLMDAVEETKKADRAAGINKPDDDYKITVVQVPQKEEAQQ